MFLKNKLESHKINIKTLYKQENKEFYIMFKGVTL